MLKKCRKLLSFMLCLVMICSSGNLAYAAGTTTGSGRASNGGTGVQYDPTAKTADVVVFAHFTDDTQESADAYFADKYDTFKDYFVGDYGRAFVNYLKTVSYGAHTVNVCFPQETADGTISSIALPVSQAEAKQTNVDAQVIDAVLNAMPSLSNLAVDRDNDGYIDNLTVICKAENCSEVEQGATLVAHSNNSGNMGTTSGYKVCNYNMLNTDRLEVTKYGLLIHEYLHTLGFPDLYRTNGDQDYPVYIWDIMASVSDSPSYPLTYLRSKIGGWMELGEISESGTYTLSAQDSKSGTKGFIIQSPLRDKEVFVVEFRQRPTNLYDMNSLDRMVQGSGIIVYRVDTTVQDYSNARGYTGIWVFRPVEGVTGYNPSYGLVNIVNANLSQEAGRTSIGSANLDDGLAQGALTFTNGENSGIVISEVGSAAGDTISFKVTFPDLTDVDLWTNTNFTSSGNSYQKGVTIAEIGGDVIAVEYDGSGFFAYRQSGETWTKVSSKLSASGYADCMKLFGYNNDVYLMYSDYDSGLVVKKLDLTAGTWASVASISSYGSYFDAKQIGDKVYVSYLQGDWSDEAHLAVFDGTRITDLGKYHQSSFANGEQRVVEQNGTPCVFVRDASDNILNGYRYANGSFTKITDGSIKVNALDIAVYNNVIYAASVNSDTSCLQISTYNGTSWTTKRTDIDSAEATLTMMRDHVYVLASPSSGDGNFRMYSFANGEVTQEGDTAIDAASSGFTAITVGDKIYLSYVRMSDKMSIIKSKVASGASAGSGSDSGSEVTPSNKKNIADAVITNSENGVKVVYQGTVLTQDVDYIVTDIEGTAVITGIGADYEGTVTKIFEEVCEKSTILFATHRIATDEAVAATCEKTGLTEGSHCSVCGIVIKEQETVAMTAHSWNDGVVMVEPTVEAAGTRLFSCTVCGKTRTESIQKLEQPQLPTISMSVSAKKGSTSRKLTFVGKLDNYDAVISNSNCEITAHGLVYMTKAKLGNKSLTINSTGRTKVTFTSYKADGSFTYTINASSATTQYVVRSFVTYVDKTTGETKTVYSDTLIVSRNTAE